MENNNGRGIFYGVIGVATLIVAIIGATFAYFSAQATTNNDAITAGATVLSLSIAVDQDNLRNEMIPVETNGLIKASEEAAETTEDTNAAADAAVFPTFPAMGTVDTDPVQEGNQYRERCKDLLGNNICSIFTFTVTNPSESASQQIYGYLTVSKNEFANLKYAVYKGTPDQITTWTVNGDDPEADDNGNFQLDLGDVVQHVQAVPTNPVSTAGEANDIPGMTVTLPPEGEVTYTVLLWIEETGQDQTETDSKIDDGGTTRGRAFEGGILVNTSGGGSGVTGTLRLA